MLRIDYDSPDDVPSKLVIKRRLGRAGYQLKKMTRTMSPSGRGVHLRITLDRAPMSPFEVVALQAILGSDPVREAYNLVRVRAMMKKGLPAFWCDRWNVLYTESD